MSQHAGGVTKTLASEGQNLHPSAEMPTDPSHLTAEQIVYAHERWPWQVPALILLVLIVWECWLAAHYLKVIEGWFR